MLRPYTISLGTGMRLSGGISFRQPCEPSCLLGKRAGILRLPGSSRLRWLLFPLGRACPCILTCWRLSDLLAAPLAHSPGRNSSTSGSRLRTDSLLLWSLISSPEVSSHLPLLSSPLLPKPPPSGWQLSSGTSPMANEDDPPKAGSSSESFSPSSPPSCPWPEAKLCSGHEASQETLASHALASWLGSGSSPRGYFW